MNSEEVIENKIKMLRFRANSLVHACDEILNDKEIHCGTIDGMHLVTKEIMEIIELLLPWSYQMYKIRQGIEKTVEPEQDENEVRNE